jgi:hypothetical protein
MSIKQYLDYQALKGLYNLLDNKKRLVVMIASMGIIIIVWLLFFIVPLKNKSSLVNTNARIDLNYQIKTAQSTMIKLIQATQAPEDSSKEAYTLFYDNLLSLYMQNKIESNIDNIIQVLLNNRYGLELNDFHNTQIPIPTQFNSSDFPLKPYTINLSFTGSFLQMASYLKQFENPEIPLYFKNISFGLTQYPEGKLTLTILTIVADKKFSDQESKAS